MQPIDYQGEKFKDFVRNYRTIDDTTGLYRKITIEQAAEMLGVSRNQVYKYFSSPNLDDKLVVKIINAFEVSVDDIWGAPRSPEVKIGNNANLISDMFHVDQEGSNNKYIDIGNGVMLMLTPLVDEYGYAGYLTGFKDPEYLEELPTHPIFVNKYHKGNYQSFQAVGDSMTTINPNEIESNIYHGNIVTGREIIQSHWRSHLHTHQFLDYVIVHKEGILIKRVVKHDVENGVLTLHSLNEDRASYPDFEVMLKDVYQIFSIVEVNQKRKR